MSRKREVTKQGQTDLSLFEGQDTGFEGTDAQTFKTPFLKILQALSPELKESDPKFVPEAKMGLLFNTATQNVSKELEIIILKVEHTLVVWQPNRGGFVGRYSKAMEGEVVTEKEGVQKWDKDGNHVMDTIEFYCLNVNNPTEIFVFPLSAASLKHAKSFATRLRMLTIDGVTVGVSWAGIWKISTVEETNDKGSWYTLGATPEFIRSITPEEKHNLINPAKEMLKTAEVNYSAIESSVASDEEVTY